MKELLADKTKNKYIILGVCIVLLIFCFAVLAPKFSVAETYSSLTKSLDDKRSTAIEMSAVLAGASVAIASVPGDATTPIADQIAGMNSYLIVVIAAIMLEKYLLPIIGMLVFKALIPIAIALVGVYGFVRKRVLLSLSVLLAVVSLALMLVIPVGIMVGDEIDRAYGLSTLTTKIENDLNVLDKERSDAKESETKDSDTKKSDTKKSDSKQTETKKTDTKTELWNKVSGFFSDTAENITETASVGLENIKVILGDFLDVIAALIISTCVIPIIICIAFYWIAKAAYMYCGKLITRNSSSAGTELINEN